MKFKYNKASSLHWLATFYIECGYGGEFDGSDDVYYVSDNEQIVAVVRIAKEHGVYILRGMQVLPNMRGNQIGRRLLSFLAPYLNLYPSECFCLPHAHLESFYGDIDFKPLSNGLAPDFIQVRKEHYFSRGLNISLLVRK